MSAAEGLWGENLVKRKLWQRGHKVKDVSRYTHFDLLVDDKYRVEVKTIVSWGKHKRRYIKGLRKEEFDVLSIIVEEPTSVNMFFASQKDLEPFWTKPMTNLNNGIPSSISFEPEDLKKYFHKNFKKVNVEETLNT